MTVPPTAPEPGGTPAADGEGNSPRRTSLGVIFLTLFLDLVGFSIIFPLFPAILEYYAEDATLIAMVDVLRSWFSIDDPADPRVQVLFGGVLGSLYSLFQFFASGPEVGRSTSASSPWAVVG